MKKFEVGKRYLVMKIEYGNDVTAEIIKRTEKTVTVAMFPDSSKSRKVKRCKILNGSVEQIIFDEFTIFANEEVENVI